MPCATLAGRYAGDDFRAVVDHLLRVEAAFAAGEALDENARLFVDEDAHRAAPASATAFSAPSFIPFATVKFSPELRRISWPCFTLVPSIRTTIGALTLSSFAALTMPLASMSQRRMPPNTLMKTT